MGSGPRPGPGDNSGPSALPVPKVRRDPDLRRLEGARMEKDVDIKLHFTEDDTETVVHAELLLRGDHFESINRARRHPDDPCIPVIGEEVALARALAHLSMQVMQAAQEKIDQFEPTR